MTFDPARGRVVLLDLSGHSLDPAPLREWNGSEWTLIPGSETLRRTGATLIADPRSGRLMLIGGRTGPDTEADLAWSGTAWEPVVYGPPPRRARAAYDAARGVVVMTGGLSQGSFNTVWEWTGQSWSRRPDSELGQAGQTQPVYAPARAAILSIGLASLDGGFSPVHEWDGLQWSAVETAPGAPAPHSRTNHAVAYDTHRETAVLFGGLGQNNVPKEDTWEFTGDAWASVLAPVRPSPRFAHAMTYDPVRRRTLLFGGIGHNYSRELWSYDGPSQTWSLTSQTGPPPPAHPAMTFDTHRGVALLFGGLIRAGAPSAGLWQWDGASWTFVTVQGPRPASRAAAAFVYDPSRRAALLHGGYTFNDGSPFHPYFYDTWVLHNAADHDIDGGIDSGDVAAFLETWLRSIQEGTLEADYDLSGATTSADISAFITAWHVAVGHGC